MRSHCYFRHAALSLASILALCLAPCTRAADEEPKAPVVNSALDADLFSQLILSELKFGSGETALAFQLMLDAARRSADEKLFRRATDMAWQVRDGPLALSAVKAWRVGAPKSLEAALSEVQVLMALQRPAEAATAAGNMIALAKPEERGPLIASVPRMFARTKDLKGLPALLEPAMAPWVSDPSTRVQAQVALGRLWVAAGQPDKALPFIRNAHAQEPEADGPALLSLELMATTAQAEAVVVGYLKAKPTATQFRVLYARILGTQQRAADAVPQLEQVIREAPRQGAPWLMLGSLHLELKQPAKTTAVVTEYLKRLSSGDIDQDGESPMGPPLGENDGDADTEDTSITQAYFLLSRAAEQQKDYAAAESWLGKINDPQRAMDVLLRRATLLADQGQLQKAIELVRKAPDTTPDSPRDKFNIEAQLLTNAKQWAAAEAVLAKANQRFPNDSDLLYQQSMMAEKLNRIEDMERLLKRVIEIRPDHYHAYNALGYSLADRNMRLPEAREMILKALSLAPNEPFITDSLGWVEYRLGRKDEALRLLQQAYRLRPDVEIGVHLAEVLWVTGQRDEARRILREAKSKDDTNEVLRETLTRLRVDL